MNRLILLAVVMCISAAFDRAIGDDPADVRATIGESNTDAHPLLPNLLKITDQMYCGAEPSSEDAFARLATYGIKTLVSVDGARPDIEQARRHGLRYVHIPIGYDGIDEHAQLSLARLVREGGGPFYVHCHHGRHRGPTAAAIACIAGGEMDHRAAVRILNRAGTSTDYAGLWRSVETYRIPPQDAELPELVEVAAYGSLAAAMANIDRVFANLQRCQEAGWVTPRDHPDLIPRQQALLLKEGFRESSRNLPSSINPEVASWLGQAEVRAEKIESALKANDLRAAAKQYRLLGVSCTQCHARHRN